MILDTDANSNVDRRGERPAGGEVRHPQAPLDDGLAVLHHQDGHSRLVRLDPGVLENRVYLFVEGGAADAGHLSTCRCPRSASTCRRVSSRRQTA